MPLVPGPGQLFDLSGDHVANRLAGLIGLSPSLHASPPDPVSIPRFYDADYDDAVVFLTNMGVVTGRPLEVGRASTFAFTRPVRPDSRPHSALARRPPASAGPVARRGPCSRRSQPYQGILAVRNVREGEGDAGFIRSPVSAVVRPTDGSTPGLEPRGAPFMSAMLLRPDELAHDSGRGPS